MTVTTPDGGAVAMLAHRIAPTVAETDPARFQRRRRLVERSLSVMTPVVLLLLWQIVATANWLDMSFFPPPLKIIEAADGMIRDGVWWSDVSISARRVLIGFGAGTIVGVATGTILAATRIARAAFEPLLSALYTVPKLALLPLLLMLFGLGEVPKIILIALGTFFLMWISTFEAIVKIPAGYIQAGTALGVSPWQRFRHITFPAMLPSIFTGMRISIGNAVLIMVAIEFVQATQGVGYRIWNSWSVFAVDRMYVGIVTVALMGFLFTTILKAISRFVLPWTRA